MNNYPNNPFEKIEEPNTEKEDIQKLAEITTELLDKRYTSKNKKILRGVHPKSHGCVQAVFKINQDIEAQYQVGLFSTPGLEYQALFRLSNATANVEHDLGSQ